MEQHLKKRLLGAVVTVLIIAVVLPIILNTQYLPSLERQAIPQRPGIAIVKTDDERQQIRQHLEKLQSGEAREEITLQDPRVVEDDDQPIAGVDGDQLALDAGSRPVIWTLQVGAFKQLENAQRLLSKLREDGFKAYSLVFPSTEVTRVYVGPMQTRNEAESIRGSLRQQLELDDIYIARYQAEP